MAKIRAVANIGYSFTVDLFQPLASYAAYGTGFTSSELVDGVYEIDVGSKTGIVYAVMTSGALKVVGFANLDASQADGRCELFDTLEEARNSTLLTSQDISVVSPVRVDGTLEDIQIGDDYTASYGRVFSWTIAKPTGFTSSWTARFGGKRTEAGTDYGWDVAGSIVDNGTTITIRAELAGADTIGCVGGVYTWSTVLFSTDGKKMTQVRNKKSRLVTLIESEVRQTA